MNIQIFDKRINEFATYLDSLEMVIEKDDNFGSDFINKPDEEKWKYCHDLLQSIVKAKSEFLFLKYIHKYIHQNNCLNPLKTGQKFDIG